MAVAVNAVRAAQFKDLFEKPTVDKIYHLSPHDVEKFVQYVFESAGHLVTDVHTITYPEGLGVDLLLHHPLNPDVVKHGVEVKRWLSKVGPVPVQAFAYQLQQQSLTGYFVSVNGFTPAAYAVAANDPTITLIDGEHLLRFIEYIGRSRVDRAYSNIQLPLAEPAGPEWTLRADELLKKTPKVPQRARIIAIANNKGGVGKSTTARCLGMSLATHNQRVLLIDMDAQANLTDFMLQYEADDATPHLAGYFAGAYSLADAVTAVPGFRSLWLVQGHLDLGPLDTGGSGHPEVELRFVSDLYQLAGANDHKVYGRFDWIILDTPPAISLYTRTALAAADYVIAPARARRSSVRGSKAALHARHAMNALVGRARPQFGGVVTHLQNDQRSIPERDRLQVELSTDGGIILGTSIPWSAAVETPTPPHAIREAYDRLAQEVMRYAANG